MNQDSLYQAFQRYNQAKELNDRVKQIRAGTYVDPQNQGYESGALAAASGLTGTTLADEEQQTLNVLSNLNTLLNGRNTRAGLQSIQGANDVIESAVQYGNRDTLDQAGDIAKSTAQGAVESVGGLATLGALPFGQAENVGNFVNGLDEAIDATKSDSYQSGNLYKQYRSQAINNWADRTYGENPTGIKSLAKLGHTVIKNAENMTGSEVAEGIGNLAGQLGSTLGAGKIASLAGSAAMKGLGISAKLATKTAPLAEKYNAFRTGLATKGGFLGRQAADMLSSEGLRNTAFLASQEMGAAANQLVADMSNVPNEQLYNTNTAYRQLVDSYMNQGMGISDAMNQARSDLINSLATQAATEATPGAIAAGIVGDKLASFGKRAIKLTPNQINRAKLYEKHADIISTAKSKEAQYPGSTEKAIEDRNTEFRKLALTDVEQEEYTNLTKQLQQAVVNNDKATVQNILPRYTELSKKAQDAIKEGKQVYDTNKANSFAGRLEEAIMHPVKSTAKTVGEVGAEASGEAAAEYFSNRGVNKIAQENYDPDRDINEGVAESMAQAFVSTGALGGAKKVPMGATAGTALVGHAAYKAVKNPLTNSVYKEIQKGAQERKAQNAAKAEAQAKTEVEQNAQAEANGTKFAEEQNAEVIKEPNLGSIDTDNINTNIAEAALKKEKEANELRENSNAGIFTPKGGSYNQTSISNNGKAVNTGASYLEALIQENQKTPKSPTQVEPVVNANDKTNSIPGSQEEALKKVSGSDINMQTKQGNLPENKNDKNSVGINYNNAEFNFEPKENNTNGKVETLTAEPINKEPGQEEFTASKNMTAKEKASVNEVGNFSAKSVNKNIKPTYIDPLGNVVPENTKDSTPLSDEDMKVVGGTAYNATRLDGKTNPFNYETTVENLKTSVDQNKQQLGEKLSNLSNIYKHNKEANNPYAKAINDALDSTASIVQFADKYEGKDQRFTKYTAHKALENLIRAKNTIDAQLKNPNLSEKDKNRLYAYYRDADTSYEVVKNAIRNTTVIDENGNKVPLLSDKVIAKHLNDKATLFIKETQLTKEDDDYILKEIEKAKDEQQAIKDKNESPTQLSPRIYILDANTGKSIVDSNNDSLEKPETIVDNIVKNKEEGNRDTTPNRVNKLTAALFSITHVVKPSTITALINFGSKTPIRDAFVQVGKVYKNIYEKTIQNQQTNKVDPVAFYQAFKNMYNQFGEFLAKFNNTVSTQLLDGGRLEEALNPNRKNGKPKLAYQASNVEGILSHEGMGILPFLEEVVYQDSDINSDSTSADYKQGYKDPTVSKQLILNQHFYVPVMLATLQFISDIPNFTNPVSLDKALTKYKEYSSIESGDLDADSLRKLAEGTTRTALVNHFADLLKDMTGFHNNDSISSSVDSQAQFKALANELLDNLLKKDNQAADKFTCLQQEVITYTKADGKPGHITVITRYKGNSVFEFKNKKERRALDRVISEIAHKNYQLAYGPEELKPHSPTLNGDPTTKETKPQDATIKAMEQVRCYPNKRFIIFLRKIKNLSKNNNILAKFVTGVDNLYDDKGNVSDDVRGNYSVESLNTITGRSLSITTAADKALEIANNLEDFDEKYQYVKFPGMTISNGRIMLKGDVTGQSNKLFKQAISVVNEELHKSNAKDMVTFKLATAMALGVNPKKVSQEAIEDKVAELEAFIKDNGSILNNLNLAEVINKFFTQFFGEDYARTDTKQSDIWAGLNALLNYEAYLNSSGDTFHNTVSIEIDASTKGILDSMLNASGSEVGKDFDYAMLMAGNWFGNLTDDQIEAKKSEKQQNKDAYERPSEEALKNINEHRNKFSSTNESNKAYADKFNTLMKDLLGDYITINKDDSIEGITRKLLKKLVTSINYSQGLNSSIEKFISDVLIPRLAYLIDNNKASAETLDAFNYVINNIISYNDKTKTDEVIPRDNTVDIAKKAKNQSFNNFLGKGIDGSAYNALYAALKHFIFTDLHKAITQNQSETYQKALTVMTSMTTIMSAWNRHVILDYAQKYQKNFGILLSRKALKDFIAKNCFDTHYDFMLGDTLVATQNFEKIATDEAICNREITNLNGGSVNNSVPLPINPGVNIGAKSVQNLDAIMQYTAYALSSDNPLNNLNMFDGTDLPLKNVAEGTSNYNQASFKVLTNVNVLQSWTTLFKKSGNQDKFQKCAEWISSLSKEDKEKLDTVSQQLIQSAENAFTTLEGTVGKTTKIKAEDGNYEAAIYKQLINDAETYIQTQSNEQAVKQAALSHMPMTISNMSTGDSSENENYFKVNEDTALAQAMKENPDKINALANTYIKEAFLEYARNDNNLGAISWSTVEQNAIDKVLGDKAKDIEVKPQNFIEQSIYSLILDKDDAAKFKNYLTKSNLKVYYAPASTIQSYVPDFNYKSLGCYDSNSNTIWINQDTSSTEGKQTLVHEYVHALITGALYNLAEKTKDMRSSKVPAEQAYLNMVDNLNKFKRYFKHGIPKDAPKELVKLYQIYQIIEPMSDVDAINELLAYTLSDLSIAQALDKYVKTGKATVTEKVIGFIKDIFNGIKDILGLSTTTVTMSFSRASRFNFHFIADAYTTAKENKVFNALASEDSTIDAKSFLNKLQNNITISNAHIPQANMVSRTNPLMQKLNEVNAFPVAELAAKHSFNLTRNQQVDLTKIMAAVTTAMKLNSDLVPELQNLRDAVLQTIDLRNLGNTGSDTNTGTDRYNFLTNIQNEYDANLALPVFIGLSLVSPELKDALKTVNISKQLIKDITTPGSYGNSVADRLLNSIGNKVITTIGDACAGKYKDNANAEQVLNTYLTTLQDNDLVKDRNNLINNLQNSYMDKADDFTRELIAKTFAKIADQHLFSGSESELGALANNLFENLPRAVSVLFTKDGITKSDILLRLLRNQLNRADEHPLGNNFLVHSFTNIMDELFSADKNKADLAQIQKKALASVQGIRQLYNELIPALLDKSFKQEGHRLLRQEKAKLYDALITTDLGALSNSQIDDLAHNKEDKIISSLEEELASKSGTLYKHYQRKAKQLAHYMVTDEPGANLLTNANTIAHLFGEGIKVNNIDPDVVSIIDALVSAYAYKELDSDTKKLFRDLTKECPKSMLMAVNQQGGARQYDLDLINSSTDTKFAYIKGANNTTNMMDRKVLAVTSVPEMQKLQHLGYHLVHTSSGSILRDKNKKIYYMVCDISNRANFNQGTLQNIVDTHGGVNVNTLVATSISTAGYYRDPNVIAQYAHRLTHDTGKENFIATYDANGKVIFLHQALDPEVIKPYRASKDFLKSVGSWSGSQVESILAKQFNSKAIKALADQYRREATSSNMSRDYINLFDSKVLARNPVWRDAVRNINTTTRYMIEKEFGQGKFMVRRDLVDDVIGRRAMSITDMFTGISNANPTVLHCAAKFCEMIMGQNAFKYLANTEYAVQTVMSWARNTIVVKSGIVPAMNACANAVQLMMRGVPINVIMTETPKIIRQLEQLNSSRRREVEIAMELAKLQREGYKQHQAEVNKLIAERRQLVANRNQLGLIAPLVNAGEYNTIADIGLQQDTLLPGKFGEYVTDQLEKMPKSVVSAGKYLLITKDTSLYKGLEKTVQYGDFVAKTIYYRHLLDKGISEAEALRKVRYEFVNYDTMGGRAREYLENIGLLWFYNFKLRSTRVAFSMITENPLRALLSIMIPGADTFGTPIIDNVLAKIFTGTLPSSMGPDMFMGLWEKNLYNVLTDAF